MSQPIKSPYIERAEPVSKNDKKSHHSRKRSDSGYGGTSSDRSSRLSGSRRSNESATGSGGYIEPEVNMSTQRLEVRTLQSALQASIEDRERLDKERYDLEQNLAARGRESKRLRSERDTARKQNDELRASLSLAYDEIERYRKEVARYQKESKKSTSKSSSKTSKEAWRDLPVPLYNREQSPPEMPRNSRPTSSSRPNSQRRMSMSQAPSYTYTVQPTNYE